MWREIFKNNKITVTYNTEPAPPAKTSKQKSIQEKAHSPEEITPHTKGVFQARDKTSIYYEVYGQGRPLLMCYGLVCRREHWRHQLPHFVKNYQVILFDYRGHQFSGRPANDRHLTLEWCANDIQDLLNYLKVDEVVGLGHSMGVGVLARAVALEKSKFKGVVFICGTVNNPFELMFYSDGMNRVHQVASALFDLMPGTVSVLWHRLTRNNLFNFIIASHLGFNSEKSHQKDVSSYIEGVNQIPFAVFHSLIDDYTRFEGKKHLEEITCPALVITGDKDIITPKPVQDEIVATLKQGEMHVVPEGSHNTHTDFPAEVNETIDQFLEKIRYR
ncbi:MAG: alpha/beta hydrolase [Proteobacteria bacterium]|nr:alpha/beta hydrolase [Pseudomonadota bacterium]